MLLRIYFQLCSSENFLKYKIFSYLFLFHRKFMLACALFLWESIWFFWIGWFIFTFWICVALCLNRLGTFKFYGATVFLQGNRLFKEGKFELAKAKYEKVINAGFNKFTLFWVYLEVFGYSAVFSFCTFWRWQCSDLYQYNIEALSYIQNVENFLRNNKTDFYFSNLCHICTSIFRYIVFTFHYVRFLGHSQRKEPWAASLITVSVRLGEF